MSIRTWSEAESRAMQREGSHAPVAGAPWVALMKFSSGEWNVTQAERDMLLAYGLIQKSGSRMVLTAHGRQTLGLAA